MTLLGIGLTGTAATAFTLAFAGIVFAVVVAIATVLYRRRQAQRNACTPTGPDADPVPVELLSTRREEPADRALSAGCALPSPSAGTLAA
jgi:hypothetical protein